MGANGVIVLRYILRRGKDGHFVPFKICHRDFLPEHKKAPENSKLKGSSALALIYFYMVG